MSTKLAQMAALKAEAALLPRPSAGDIKQLQLIGEDYCCYGQDGQLLPNWKAADLARRIERMEYDPDYLNELAEEFEQRKLEEEVRYMEAHAHDHRRP